MLIIMYDECYWLKTQQLLSFDNVTVYIYA